MSGSIRPRVRGITAVSALSLSFAAPLMAASTPMVSSQEPGTITRTVEVITADLNLNVPAGESIAHKRIASAARQACGYSGMHGLKQPKDFTRCEAKAKQDALAQLHPVQTASR